MEHMGVWWINPSLQEYGSHPFERRRYAQHCLHVWDAQWETKRMGTLSSGRGLNVVLKDGFGFVFQYWSLFRKGTERGPWKRVVGGRRRTRWWWWWWKPPAWHGRQYWLLMTEILHQLLGCLSSHLQGFDHPCRMLAIAINSMSVPFSIQDLFGGQSFDSTK